MSTAPTALREAHLDALREVGTSAPAPAAVSPASSARRPAGEGGFGEMELSALQEVGNVLTRAHLDALATLTGLHLEPSRPAWASTWPASVSAPPSPRSRCWRPVRP